MIDNVSQNNKDTHLLSRYMVIVSHFGLLSHSSDNERDISSRGKYIREGCRAPSLSKGVSKVGRPFSSWGNVIKNPTKCGFSKNIPTVFPSCLFLI